MTPEAFESGMARLSAMWPGRSPAPETAAVYADALRHLHDSVWRLCIDRCLRECKYFPVPAEILERADELLTDAGELPEHPESAWIAVEKAAMSVHVGQPSGLPRLILDAVRDVGGLPRLREASSDYERNQMRKEFVERYGEQRRRLVLHTPTAMGAPIINAPQRLGSGVDAVAVEAFSDSDIPYQPPVWNGWTD